MRTNGLMTDPGETAAEARDLRESDHQRWTDDGGPSPDAPAECPPEKTADTAKMAGTRPAVPSRIVYRRAGRVPALRPLTAAAA